MVMGKILVLVGGAILLLGIMLTFFPALFSWFGRLPGDITYHNNQIRAFIPITSMLIVSVLANIIIYVINKLF
jgi:hypothetical protein